MPHKLLVHFFKISKTCNKFANATSDTYNFISNLSIMKKILLTNAVIWASVLLTSAYLFQGHSNFKFLFILILGAYTVLHTVLLTHAKKSGKCCVVTHQ